MMNDDGDDAGDVDGDEVGQMSYIHTYYIYTQKNKNICIYIVYIYMRFLSP